MFVVKEEMYTLVGWRGIFPGAALFFPGTRPRQRVSSRRFCRDTLDRVYTTYKVNLQKLKTFFLPIEPIWNRTKKTKAEQRTHNPEEGKAQNNNRAEKLANKVPRYKKEGLASDVDSEGGFWKMYGAKPQWWPQ